MIRFDGACVLYLSILYKNIKNKKGAEFMSDKSKLDDAQLKNVSGGSSGEEPDFKSIDNVDYTDTTDISDDTKEKIK